MFFKKPETERAVTFADFEHGVDCPCCARNSRRTFIKTAAIVTAGLLAPADWVRAATGRERMIKMFNPPYRRKHPRGFLDTGIRIYPAGHG